jgi:alpha-aminoadipate carrier protein LysW
MVKCPECDAEIKVPADSIEGEIVSCPDCGASYEIIKKGEEISVKPAQIVGEDWGQ